MKTFLKTIFLALALTILPVHTQAVEIPFDPEDAGTVEVQLHEGCLDGDEGCAEYLENASGEDSQVNQSGVIQLRDIMLNAYYFIKYLIVASAIFFLSFTGLRLVTAGKNIEDEITKAKLNIKWVVYGVFAFMVLDVFVGTFFGYGDLAGLVFQDPTNNAVLYERATYFTREVFHVMDFILSFASLIGVLVIIVSAITIVGAFGNESIIANQKKISMIVVGGLVIVALAKTVVGRVIFGIAGYDAAGDIITTEGTIVAAEDVGFLVDAKAGTDEIIGIANYILGFVGVAALVMFVYGGLRMVLAQGDDGEIGKAKTIMSSAVIGIIIAICSFTLVATFINPS